MNAWNGGNRELFHSERYWRVLESGHILFRHICIYSRARISFQISHEKNENNFRWYVMQSVRLSGRDFSPRVSVREKKHLTIARYIQFHFRKSCVARRANDLVSRRVAISSRTAPTDFCRWSYNSFSRKCQVSRRVADYFFRRTHNSVPHRDEAFPPSLPPRVERTNVPPGDRNRSREIVNSHIKG